MPKQVVEDERKPEALKYLEEQLTEDELLEDPDVEFEAERLLNELPPATFWWEKTDQ